MFGKLVAAINDLTYVLEEALVDYREAVKVERQQSDRQIESNNLVIAQQEQLIRLAEQRNREERDHIAKCEQRFQRRQAEQQAEIESGEIH